MSRATVSTLISITSCALAISGCVASSDGGGGLQDEYGHPGGWPPSPDDDDPPPDGVRIRSPATDRCLTAAPGEVFAVATGCSKSNPFQRWDVVGDDPFEIVSVGLSDSLDVDMCLTVGVPEPGALPTLNPCDGSVSQEWDVSPVSGSPWQVTISNQDQFLEAGSGGPNVVMRPAAPLDRQRWRLSP